MNYNKKHTFLSVCLPIFILIVNYLSTQPLFIEQYYSGKIYPVISVILRKLFGWLPFSFGDTLIILFIILLVRKIFFLIKTKLKNIKHEILKLTAIISVLYFCFYFFWGLNYFRAPLKEKLNLKLSKYTNQELIHTANYITNKLNEIHIQLAKNDSVMIKNPYSWAEIHQKAPKGYKKLSKTFPDFNYKSKSIKHSLISLIQSYSGTSGYINPITNEAQINALIPKNGIPATLCHEMAHQIGWAAENEANFIGFLTAINNDDLFFKYSGYRMGFTYCYRELKKRDKLAAKKLWENLNKGIKKDYFDSQKVWKKYDNPFEPYIKKGYNSYLKANKQKKGIASYNYVVDLLISYFSKNQLNS